MPRSIDVKSAIIGGLMVALVVCSIGAVRYVSESRHGRFKMIPTSGYTFVLDTVTGQVWSLQNLPEGIIRDAPHTLLEFYDPKTYDVSDPNGPVNPIR